MGVAIRFLDDGISTEEAKAKGVKFGRKPRVDKDRVRALHSQGVGATEIARRLKIGRSTVYKILASDQTR